MNQGPPPQPGGDRPPSWEDGETPSQLFRRGVRNTMATPPSGATPWRSQEDYLLARMAVGAGLLSNPDVAESLRQQAALLAEGQVLTLAQVWLRAQRVTPQRLMQLQGELASYLRTCPQCGLRRYLAPGPQPRREPCPQCGGPIAVPGVGSQMSQTSADRRQAAFAQGSTTYRQQDPFALQGSQEATRFGDYLLEGELAKGGMGAVYKARHAGSGQQVALKVILAGEQANERQLHRFRREVKAQQEIEHPHVLKVYEAGEWEGILYYTMDLVEGSDLARRGQDLPLPRRVEVLAQVARGVQAAHEKGYVHRDLKPANVLMTGDDRPLVMDFGLAKNVGGDTRLTNEGSIMGTPYYMAPEQAVGQVDQMGPHSDVFALGVMLYELVTGELPFFAGSALELCRQLVEKQPEPFAERGALEPELELIAFKALEKRPEDRYPSAGAMADDLERHLRGEKPQATQVGSAQRVARTMEEHKRSIGFVLALVILGLVVALGLLLGGRAMLGHMRAEQALRELQTAALEAEAELERTQAGLDAAGVAAPGSPAAGELEAAIAAGREVLARELPAGAEAPEEVARLRAALAAGLVRRGQVALARSSGAAAGRALEWAEEARGLEAGEELLAEAWAVTARAERRLGHAEEARAAADALAAAGDEPRARLLRGLLTLDAGDAAGALAAWEGLRGTAPVRRARAQALLALGRGEEADELLALAAEQDPRGRAAEAAACLAEGDVDRALAALRALLEVHPDEEGAAARLTALLLDRGRPDLAQRVLAQAARKEPGRPALQARLAWARLHLGLAGEHALGQLEGPWVALRRADLAAVRGAAESPYAAGDHAGHVSLRAAHARWAAAHGAAEEAAAALAELGAAAEADLPHDAPPPPELGRVLRDLGWAHLLLGRPAEAARLARGALRGRPGDLDALLLLARADEEERPALEEAFLAQARALDGALGRGLFLARAARYLEDEALAERARPLLEAALARCPGLPPARAQRAALGPLLGEERPPGGEAAEDGLLERLLDWEALVPETGFPPPVDEERRAQAKAIEDEASALPRVESEESRDRLAEALELDPNHLPALYEYAVRHVRVSGENGPSYRTWLDYLRRRPRYLLLFLRDLIRLWYESHMYRSYTPAEHVAAAAEADPDDPRGWLVWVVEGLAGHLYPESSEPPFSRVPLPELEARLDRSLHEDPLLFSFLAVRAHLRALAGDLPAARRDLELAQALAAAQPAGTWDGGGGQLWSDLHEVWVLLAADEQAALARLEQLNRDHPELSLDDDGKRTMHLLLDRDLSPLEGRPPAVTLRRRVSGD